MANEGWTNINGFWLPSWASPEDIEWARTHKISSTGSAASQNWGAGTSGLVTNAAIAPVPAIIPPPVPNTGTTPGSTGNVFGGIGGGPLGHEEGLGTAPNYTAPVVTPTPDKYGGEPEIVSPAAPAAGKTVGLGNVAGGAGTNPVLPPDERSQQPTSPYGTILPLRPGWSLPTNVPGTTSAWAPQAAAQIQQQQNTNAFAAGSQYIGPIMGSRIGPNGQQEVLVNGQWMPLEAYLSAGMAAATRATAQAGQSMQEAKGIVGGGSYAETMATPTQTFPPNEYYLGGGGVDNFRGQHGADQAATMEQALAEAAKSGDPNYFLPFQITPGELPIYNQYLKDLLKQYGFETSEELFEALGYTWVSDAIGYEKPAGGLGGGGYTYDYTGGAYGGGWSGGGGGYSPNNSFYSLGLVNWRI